MKTFTDLPALVELTPAVLAAAFWGMDSTQQAQVFAELHKLGDTFSRECQWHYLGKDLEKPGMDDARGELMSLAAPLYWHTLRAAA